MIADDDGVCWVTTTGKYSEWMRTSKQFVENGNG
jgi:hypothetical protein